MRLIVCVLLFGLALVGQCVRMKSQLRNRVMLQSGPHASENVDVWIIFGKKVDATKMSKPHIWESPVQEHEQIMGLSGPLTSKSLDVLNRRFNGEVSFEAAICIHEFPKENYAYVFRAVEQKMDNYLLSLDFHNRYLFYGWQSAPHFQFRNTASIGKKSEVDENAERVEEPKYSLVTNEYNFKEKHHPKDNRRPNLFSAFICNVVQLTWISK
eukprot:Platyproteum_vivax@DN4109_c0_g1_i2.p1